MPFKTLKKKQASRLDQTVPVRTGKTDLSGTDKISIELADSPAKIHEYSDRYSRLVDLIAETLKDEYGIKGYEKKTPEEKKEMEEQFIIGCWSIMKGNLEFEYETNSTTFLSECIDSFRFDCDNSAILILDVANKLGIPAEIAVVPSHALITTNNFLFETSPVSHQGEECYGPIESFSEKYPVVYLKTSDPSILAGFAYDTRGHRRYQNGRYDESIADHTKAIELTPTIPQPYINRGNSHYKKGETKKAFADYNGSIELAPEEGVCFYNRGVAYAGEGDFDNAIKDFTKAIKLNPEDLFAYIDRGLCYLDKEQQARAVEDFTKVINKLPNPVALKVWTYNNRANAYFKGGDTASALADYGHALSINRYDFSTYYNRGLLYLHEEQNDKAIADYDIAIRINPNFPSSYQNRGLAYFKKGEYGKAIADYTTAIGLSPDYEPVIHNRGLAYFKSGDFDKAISDYTRAIELNPDNPSIYEHRADAYKEKGEEEKAQADYEKARQLQ